VKTVLNCREKRGVLHLLSVDQADKCIMTEVEN